MHVQHASAQVIGTGAPGTRAGRTQLSQQQVAGDRMIASGLVKRAGCTRSTRKIDAIVIACANDAVSLHGQDATGQVVDALVHLAGIRLFDGAQRTDDQISVDVVLGNAALVECPDPGQADGGAGGVEDAILQVVGAGAVEIESRTVVDRDQTTAAELQDARVELPPGLQHMALARAPDNGDLRCGDAVEQFIAAIAIAVVRIIRTFVTTTNLHLAYGDSPARLPQQAVQTGTIISASLPNK